MKVEMAVGRARAEDESSLPMPKLQGEFPPAMRPPSELKWTPQTDDMMTAPLGNGWTATLYHGGDKPELSVFNPHDQEMGAPKQYKDINEAMLAAPAWIEKGITPEGVRPGDPMPEGFAGGGVVRMSGGGAKPKTSGPSVIKPSRIDMHFKDVTKRTPELQEGANRLISGDLSAAEYDALVNQYKPVTPYATVPTPATREEAEPEAKLSRPGLARA
jgi:hypothetical protein